MAENKVYAIRKKDTTKQMAQLVYIKHGSRSRRDSNNERPFKKKRDDNQPRIQAFLLTQPQNLPWWHIVIIPNTTNKPACGDPRL